jgi:hypothetical protein
MDSALYVQIGGTPDDADRFLNDILDDEELRERISAGAESAVDALKCYGINVSVELLGDPVELPSVEDLREAIEAIDRGEFSSELVMFRFWPIFFAMIRFRRFRSQAS